MQKDIVNLFFGDSICFGCKDEDGLGWVNRLKVKNDLVKKQYFFNLGIPGNSTIEVVKRFENELQSRFNDEDTFNIIFEIGIKDAKKVINNPEYEDIFKFNIDKLITIAKKYTSNIYFLGLMDVDLNIRTDYKQEGIDKIDNLLKEVCESNSVIYINMRNVIELTDLADGLHPNSVGYEKMSNYLYKELWLKYLNR